MSYPAWLPILFQGEMPWLGILFWSIFSTSIVFYAFIITAFVYSWFHPVIKLIGWFDIEQRPAQSLALTFMLLVTIGFVMAGFAG